MHIIKSFYKYIIKQIQRSSWKQMMAKNIMIHALLIKCDAEHILKICGLDLTMYHYTINIHNLIKIRKQFKKGLFYGFL